MRKKRRGESDKVRRAKKGRIERNEGKIRGDMR